MKRHRFYYPAVTEHTSVMTDRHHIHQIRNVLRAKGGDELVLWKSGEGADYVFEIKRISPKQIDGAVSSVLENDREPRARVALYCALLKRENFELVCQKATEVGVSAIYPLVTERTVKTGFNKTRAEQIIQEAAEQSGRGVLPELGEPMVFEDALIHTRGCDERYFFHVNESDNTSLRLENTLSGNRLKEVPSLSRSLSAFIGPEGGWTAREVASAKEAGCIGASLGPLTLRAETAAIVAAYLLCT